MARTTEDGDVMDQAAVLLLLVGLVAAIWAGWRNVRKDEGVCERCGYDLRASRGRCPECGEPIPFRRRSEVAGRLRDHWPTDAIAPRVPHADEERTVVHTTPQRVEADLLCAQLVARGTFARVEPRVAGGLLSDEEVRVVYEVFCWSDDAELAREMARRLTAEAEPVPLTH